MNFKRPRFFSNARSAPAAGIFLAALLSLVPASSFGSPCEWRASEPCVEDVALIGGRLATLNGEMSAPSSGCAEATALPGLGSGFSRNGADCTGFIHEDGNLGTHGATIKAYLDQEGDGSPFFNSPRPGMVDPPAICPNWERLSRREKIHFWVWVMGAIAWSESTCLADRINSSASNGTAVGLLQLDDSYANRSWRGPN